MDKKIMKKRKTYLTGLVLGMVMLLVGVQGAMAQNPTCEGTVYFKAPSEWAGAWIGGFNVNTLKKMVLNADGYYVYDLANLGVKDKLFFAIGNQSTPAGSLVVRKAGFGISPSNGAGDANWPTNDADIACPGSGNVIYVMENPLNPGTTYISSDPPSFKYFYVLVPEEKEWQSDDMMIHYEVGAVKKDTAMSPAKDMCGWFSMVFKDAPTNVYMYLKNTPTLQLGLNGLWGGEDVATPVQLDLLYEAFDTNNLYFIPDDIDWPEGSEADAGWFVSDPGVPEAGDNSRCSFSLAAIIYDTDQDINPVFSSDGDGVKNHTNGCVGVHHGLVKEDLGADNKPVYSGSADAVKCFQSEALFNTLFNHDKQYNEVQCYDMPFRHYGNDTRWGYDSDSTHYSVAGQELTTAFGFSFSLVSSRSSRAAVWATVLSLSTSMKPPGSAQ